MKNRLLILLSILVLSLVFVGCGIQNTDIYNYDSVEPPPKGVPVDMLISMGGKLPTDFGDSHGEAPSSGESLSTDQVEIIINVIDALDEKVIAGEIIQEMKLDIISKVLKNEVDLMEIMTEFNISPQ